MKKFLLILMGVSFMLCILGGILESQLHILRRAYDNWILDNEYHYLPCEKWPEATEVERIVQAHQEVIHQIEQVNPGQVFVDVDTWTCPGKADLLISYASHRDRLAIKQIIGADTFFGVPYRMENR